MHLLWNAYYPQGTNPIPLEQFTDESGADCAGWPSEDSSHLCDEQCRDQSADFYRDLRLSEIREEVSVTFNIFTVIINYLVGCFGNNNAIYLFYKSLFSHM